MLCRGWGGARQGGGHPGPERRRITGVPDPPTPTSQDTLVLLRALENSERFRRDSVLGGIFHPGKISFREVSPTDSLHVLIDGNRVSAHVDTYSPLRIAGDGSAHYHWSRVVVHNLWAAAGDLARRLLRQSGEQRCNLTCEIEWVDDDELADGPDGEECCA